MSGCDFFLSKVFFIFIYIIFIGYKITISQPLEASFSIFSSVPFLFSFWQSMIITFCCLSRSSPPFPSSSLFLITVPCWCPSHPYHHHQQQKPSSLLLFNSLGFLISSLVSPSVDSNHLFSTHFSIISPPSLFFFIATIDLVDSSPYLSASSLPCFFSIGTITASLRFQNSAPPSSSFFLIDRNKQHLLSFLIVFSIIPSSLRFRWAATSPVTVSIFILELHHLLQSLASSSSPLLSWSTPSAKVILL